MIMTKKQNQKRKQELAERSLVESLSFQVHYGLKMMGREEDELFQQLANAEINFISELGITQDILSLKNLVDGVKRDLQVEPTPEKGDFQTSVSAIALGIASIPSLDSMKIPVSWEELVKKRMLEIFYPEDIRSQVLQWAKQNGFSTSTYLGQPIVKFDKIYIVVKRTRN